MELPVVYLEDPARMQALAQAALLDTPPEQAFDRLTRLAARVIGVPIAVVSLVDKNRQFFKSAVGLPEPWAGDRQTPLSHSFCRHVVLSAEKLIVPDAREHPVLKDNPAISHGVIAYAGFPLITHDGLVLGSFCAIDTKPHPWTQDQIDILRDLTASVMTEIELRRKNDELRQANRGKDNFIAMLSHDLRTPLTPALLTAAELAADQNLPEHVRQAAQLIHRNIELEVRMIDSLFDVTRIVSGKLCLQIEDVDVHAVLRESVTMCAPDASAKSIDVSVELRAVRSGLRADAGKLQQVFCNVLKNAIKFSGPESRIVVRSMDDGADSLKIEFSDAGMGIAPDVLPNIFSGFEQGERTVTQRFGGLGLGLAICKGIVEAHHGVISACSAGVGQGATISIVLPAATIPVHREVAPVAIEPKPRRQLKILLVEDHEESLRVMSRLLRKFEHQVTTATCVCTALKAAAVENFDLLISDLGLPDGTGLDLMKKLLAQRPIKGIALTGYGMESDIAQTREAGFQKHLTKPIDFQELQDTILAMS